MVGWSLVRYVLLFIGSGRSICRRCSLFVLEVYAFWAGFIMTHGVQQMARSINREFGHELDVLCAAEHLGVTHFLPQHIECE